MRIVDRRIRTNKREEEKKWNIVIVDQGFAILI